MKSGALPNVKTITLKERLRQHAGAEATLEALVGAGCDRSMFLFLLAAQPPTPRGWADFQEVIAANPKRIGVLARQLEETAQLMESILINTLLASFFDPKIDLRKLADEMHMVAKFLLELAGSPGFRVIRRAFSYRQMGNLLPTALLCHYVKSKIGEPCYREIAELLSAASEKTIGEDALRHRANRAISKLTMKGRVPRTLDVILSMASPRQ